METKTKVIIVVILSILFTIYGLFQDVGYVMKLYSVSIVILLMIESIFYFIKSIKTKYKIINNKSLYYNDFYFIIYGAIWLIIGFYKINTNQFEPADDYMFYIGALSIGIGINFLIKHRYIALFDKKNIFLVKRYLVKRIHRKDVTINISSDGSLEILNNENNVIFSTSMRKDEISYFNNLLSFNE